MAKTQIEISRPKTASIMPSADRDSEEAKKKEILRGLYGSCPDPTMVKPPEIPLEHELPRRFDLI